MYKLSVVIPVYNSEKYIERCVVSLMEQTLQEIQYIFVNDSTPDDSLAIIERVLENYPQRRNDILILSNDINSGPSATRNKGMMYARGEYIAFCDSDDFVEQDMYEVLYKSADGDDLVFCDINIVESNSHQYMYKIYTECYNDKSEFTKKFIVSKWTPLINCIIKRNLITRYEIKLPKHIKYCEDFYFMIKAIFYANSIRKVNRPLYYYCQENEKSIMHNLSSCLGKDDMVCYMEIIDFFTKENCVEQYEKELSWRVLNAFHFDMFRPDRHKEIIGIYPTCHKYILSNPFYIKRQKQLMWMLTHHCRWIVLLFIYARGLLGRKNI